jgi:hypothetical protein
LTCVHGTKTCYKDEVHYTYDDLGDGFVETRMEQCLNFETLEVCMGYDDSATGEIIFVTDTCRINGQMSESCSDNLSNLSLFQADCSNVNSPAILVYSFNTLEIDGFDGSYTPFWDYIFREMHKSWSSSKIMGV